MYRFVYILHSILKIFSVSKRTIENSPFGSFRILFKSSKVTNSISSNKEFKILLCYLFFRKSELKSHLLVCLVSSLFALRQILSENKLLCPISKIHLTVIIDLAFIEFILKVGYHTLDIAHKTCTQIQMEGTRKLCQEAEAV